MSGDVLSGKSLLLFDLLDRPLDSGPPWSSSDELADLSPLVDRTLALELRKVLSLSRSKSRSSLSVYPLLVAAPTNASSPDGVEEGSPGMPTPTRSNVLHPHSSNRLPRSSPIRLPPTAPIVPSTYLTTLEPSVAVEYARRRGFTTGKDDTRE